MAKKKKYPVGIQSFESIPREGYVYTLLPIRLLSVLLLACFGMTASAQEISVKVDDRLKTMPSKELLELGSDYLNHNNPDSALLCWTILANVYAYDYYDYSKAFPS